MNRRDLDSENELELETMAVFQALGWETASCYHERVGNTSTYGRETFADVILPAKLQPALERLNPDLPPGAVVSAIEELARDQRIMGTTQANQEFYNLIKDGVKVTYTDDHGDDQESIVKIIDWRTPTNNDFFLASQFWVHGEMYKRRADLVGFVNGLPLVFVELKAHHRRLEHAYNDNLRDYRRTIPQLFVPNAIIILSNGSDSRIGTITSEWEHFATWKKINSEGERGIISLDTIIHGTCDPARLLDLVENFILYRPSTGELRKLVAKNHQFLGVENALARVRTLRENQRRLGVFWHTQGSGKSYSMVFFAQKVLRTLPGNWTFVIVTDREDLDRQIYQTFADVGAVTEGEDETRADSGAHLQQLLRENHRYVFTLIQKFRTVPGEQYPLLSDRDDIIVITDEAHRSQYDIFALNMRNALPNASFIGFTGTPLMAGEERTRDVFGDYVSIYNFRQSIIDGATVPLYYENRIPELQITNPDLNATIADMLDAANLEEANEHRLEREFSREYHLVTRDERLETIAEDIVEHFTGRGYKGKAMVVAIDKATAVRMYDKVQDYWLQKIDALLAEHATTTTAHQLALDTHITEMRATDMAVVVSPAQNEEADLAKKGVNIVPHRKRMLADDLESKFKDSTDPLRIVFVTAMWMTGFDVPNCSTIYLDKPMRNHTLMQTIARANRVYCDKTSGTIVDYIGMFRDLQKALAIYGSGAGGGIEEGDSPVEDKGTLVADVRQAIATAEAFCRERGVDIDAISTSSAFQRIHDLKTAADLLVDASTADAIDDSVEQVIINDELKLRFLSLVSAVDRLFKAMLPHPAANEFLPKRALLLLIAERIQHLSPSGAGENVDDVAEAISKVLDQSIGPIAYVIRPAVRDEANLIDLSKIDYDALKRQFVHGRKRTAAEKLRGAVNTKLKQMVRLNKSRMNYLERFQHMIDEYNAGAANVDMFYANLLTFIQTLSEEEQRGMVEHLSEEELAIFDLLTRPTIELSPTDKTQVKQVAHDLLEALKQGKLVLDWRKKQQARAAVQVTIADTLDRLPSVYTAELYQQKCDQVYQYIYESYFGQGHSIYLHAA